MNDKGENGRLWPIHCTFEKNVYFENKYNKPYLYRISDELKEKMNLDYGIEADKSYFKDYDNMDFTLVKPIKDAEEIPFDKIGLYLDEYRKQMPDKKHYRMTLKNYFAENLSYQSCYKTIDTSKVIEEGANYYSKIGYLLNRKLKKGCEIILTPFCLFEVIAISLFYRFSPLPLEP